MYCFLRRLKITEHIKSLEDEVLHLCTHKDNVLLYLHERLRDGTDSTCHKNETKLIKSQNGIKKR